MNGRVSTSAVVASCLEGVSSAQIEYCNMSGGDWVCWAPEYFITTTIARSLYKIKGSKYVTMENRAYDALDYAGAVGKGRFHRDIRSNGRFDLLLWWAKGDPRAVIEVKNRVFNKNQYESDLKRITGVLKRKREQSSMEFGLFVFYSGANDSSSKKSKEILEQRMETIQENAQLIVGDDFKATLNHSKIKIEGSSGWFAGCILVEYSNKQS